MPSFAHFRRLFLAGEVSFVTSMISAPLFSSGCVSRTLYRYFMRYVFRNVFCDVFYAMFSSPCFSRRVFAPCVSRHVFRAMCFALCVLRHASPLRVFRLVASCFASAALLPAFAPPSCVSASARSFCVGDLLGALLWRWSDGRRLLRLPLGFPPSGCQSVSRLSTRTPACHLFAGVALA